MKVTHQLIDLAEAEHKIAEEANAIGGLHRLIARDRAIARASAFIEAAKIAKEAAV